VIVGAVDRPILACLLAVALSPPGLSACSGAAATDIETPASARDATTPPEATDAAAASSPGRDAVATGDDTSAVADANVPLEASAGLEAGVDSDARKETGGNDAGPSLCSLICMGCCDAQGKCRAGDTVAICGATGGSCEDCSTHKCGLAESPCCGSKGCGCASILGCN
jgi:hypothetical protein